MYANSSYFVGSGTSRLSQRIENIEITNVGYEACTDIGMVHWTSNDDGDNIKSLTVGGSSTYSKKACYPNATVYTHGLHWHTSDERGDFHKSHRSVPHPYAIDP